MYSGKGESASNNIVWNIPLAKACHVVERRDRGRVLHGYMARSVNTGKGELELFILQST